MSSRSALRAPTAALCSSSPQKSPLPGAACREVEAGLWRTYDGDGQRTFNFSNASTAFYGIQVVDRESA